MKLSPAIATSTANDRVAAKKPFSVKTNVRAGLRGRTGGASDAAAYVSAAMG